MFLVNSRSPRFSAAPLGSTGEPLHLARAHLLPKLRCNFAEFLNQSSLKRLRILSLPTCVGLRYDQHIHSLRGFSWQHGISHFVSATRNRHHLSVFTRTRIFQGSPPTGLNRDVQHPDGLPSCVPPSLKHEYAGTGILTCFPSPTPFGLGLGID